MSPTDRSPNNHGAWLQQNAWVRYLFFPLVIASIGVLAYFTFRTTIQIESLRRQSVVEASFALASEKADRLDRRLIEEGNVAMVLVDPEKPERLAEKWLPTAQRETPTVRGILLLNEQREVTGFASRSGNAWQEDEQFRSLLLRRMLGDMKLVEEPREELRHLHKDYDGQTYLLSYWQRELQGRTVLVVAWHDVARIVKYMLPEMYRESTGPSRVDVLDEEGRIVFGPSTRRGEFTVAVPFPTTLYNWRLQVTPSGSDELASRVRSRRLLELLVFVFSFVVIVVAVIATLLAVERQRKATELKSEFVANVSHELKTPLALIRMFAELLQSGRTTTEEKRQEYLQIVLNESERLSNLIENVLDFARLERGRDTYELGAADLVDCLKKTEIAYRYRFEKEDVAFSVDLPASLEHPRIDPRAVQLAVTNLLDNALKYGAVGKRVELVAREAQGAVEISVIDHGTGVPSADRERIFERFERGTARMPSAQVRGSGIGLSIVKHVVEWHDGKVLVSETPGGGATFSLVFPLGSGHFQVER